MLRRIKIKQLKPGMYVENLDRSWRSVPVFRNRITSDRQVDQLVRHRVLEVVIDTDKGIDLTTPGAQPIGKTAGEAEVGAPLTDPVAYRKEIVAANTAYEIAQISVSNLMEAVRRGDKPDVSLAESAVDPMIASILRNRDAMTSLVSLKVQSDAVYQHSIRVCILSAVLGTRLGLSQRELKTLGMGALLHDTGKMRLETKLVDKAGPLSQEDFEKYKHHPLLGARIFDEAPSIEKQSLLILLQHHERADGSGFPQGLTGDQISRMAKIVMIVDTFDNLTARASAERKQTAYDALSWIRDWGSEGFDANLIDEFVEALGIYPVGSFVRMNDNRMGIVMSVHHNPSLLPQVWVVFDANQRQLPKPEIIDFADQQATPPAAIVAAVLPEKFGFDLPGYAKAHGLPDR